MFRCSRLVLIVIFLLHGCEQNDGITQISSYPSFGTCAIDTPTRDAIISADSEFVIAGWAFDNRNKSLPDIITLNLINESSSKIFTISAKREGERPDVAEAFKLPILAESGFSGHIARNVLTPGNYRIVILQASRDGGIISCAGENLRFTVR